MRLPNLNAVRMFDAAAKHLNFRLAAEELNLTQGAVAQQVRRLEADLGLKLFEREARGLALTDVGRTYHGAIRRALAIIEEATRTLKPAPAKIAISVTPSFASKWLVQRLHRFAERHPDIDLQVVASERVADFRSDGIDLAIRWGKPAVGAAVSSTLLAPIDLCAVCSPGFAEGLDGITGRDLFASQPLIQDSHSFWEILFDEFGIGEHRRIMQFNQTALAMDAAANGQGIAVAPRLLIEEDVARGRLVVVWKDENPDRGGYHIVHPAPKGRTAERDAVVAWILDEVS